MKFTSMMALTVLLLGSNGVLAQTIAVLPQNVSGVGSIQTGNAVAGKCDGLTGNFVKVTVQPSCYGANLRSGGNTLSPDKGRLELDLTIENGGSSYNSVIKFPNKVTWPENYGQTCTWDGTYPNSISICEQEGQSVTYNCTYVSAGWFLNDTLKCTRLGDPLSHGALNKDVTCGFLYRWSGANYAAVNSYQRILSVSNCGLRERNENWGSSMDVSSSVAAANITKYAKRGKLVVSYNGLPITKQSVVRDNSTGNFIVSGSRSQVTARFFQYADATEASKTELSQKVESSFDEFEECLEIKAAFLGVNQFCGSYYSPIMMFFDEQLPQFAGTSSFPLVEGVKMIYWPEKDAPGYFLALDERGSGKITSNKQLFGEGVDYKNGFEALKRLDSNKDDKIDAKDELFSKLVLWQDKNSDGVSDKGELASLASKSVMSISLKYDDKEKKSFGKRAEGRQFAEFTFKKDDKEVKGKAIDIWLAPNTMANSKAPKKK